MSSSVESSMASAVAIPSQNAILSLPSNIRRKIYRFAGVASGARILLPAPPLSPHGSIFLYHPHWRALRRREKIFLDRQDLKMTRNLILTCKLFYDEISALFYSENYFCFKPDKARDYASLLRLGPRSIAHLKHLAILLNVTSCHPLVPEQYRTEMSCQNTPTKSLEEGPNGQGNAKETVSLLTGWPDVINHILKNATNSLLHLHITYDTDSMEQAQAVVNPLIGIGPLAGCAIRFNRKWDSNLSLLAESVVRSVTGQPLPPTCNTFFHYLHLPVEVRHNILKYTDLVVPGNQVTWNRKDGYYIGRVTKARLETHIDCHNNRRPRFINDRRLPGCYCRRFHSAFRFGCRCWLAPKPLFLVCRIMRNDAEAVFFHNNRIIIMPVEGSQMIPERNDLIMDASFFFKTALRSSAICHLRYLDIVFPPFEGTYCSPGPILQDWNDTVARLKEACLHSALEVSVYMRGRQLYRRAQSHPVIANEKAEAIASAQLRILEPLAELVGIKRLHLHVGYPYAQTQSEIEHRKIDSTHEMKVNNEWQERLRKKILGEDYERLNRGIEDMSRARWRKIEPVTYLIEQNPW